MDNPINAFQHNDRAFINTKNIFDLPLNKNQSKMLLKQIIYNHFTVILKFGDQIIHQLKPTQTQQDILKILMELVKDVYPLGFYEKLLTNFTLKGFHNDFGFINNQVRQMGQKMTQLEEKYQLNKVTEPRRSSRKRKHDGEQPDTEISIKVIV
eukprot:NODE_724_length_4442_cov_0.403868.p4 type:complete len:153 gc:universal NODE_724_length_4442_cov_0.403868:3609-4067(+)